MRVVGCGGGSYFGFSFCGKNRCQQAIQRNSAIDRSDGYLLVLLILSISARLIAPEVRSIITLETSLSVWELADFFGILRTMATTALLLRRSQ